MAYATGGTPAGVPDFKPFNKLSRDELRSMFRPSRPALYQVWVETSGQSIPVGPKLPQGVAEEFAAAIRGQIALGREKTWNNPHVIAV